MLTPVHELLKAAAEPTRLRILNLLRQGSLCVSELQAILGIPQSTVSRHLAALRHAGLAVGIRQGTRALYSLAPASEPSLEAVHTLLTSLGSSDAALCADLAELRRRIREREDKCETSQS